MKLFVVMIIGLLVMPIYGAYSADLVEGNYNVVKAPATQPVFPIYQGRAVAVDGRTIRFPDLDVIVQLMDLDSCELPQWSFDEKTGHPVPCGGFAKAWLKRLIGQSSVACYVATYAPDGMPLAYCFRGRHDLGLQLITKGWARVATPNAQCPQYMRSQISAQVSHYGMWKDRVLDLSEWRIRASDRTLARQPIADYKLIFGQI